MILADTSIWVDHLRRDNALMRARLENTQIVTHPFIVGELACGNLRNRRVFLALLQTLPALAVAEDTEVLELIERHQLWGKGGGWVDMHLIASAVLEGVPIWTKDRRLAKVTAPLGVLL